MGDRGPGIARGEGCDRRRSRGRRRRSTLQRHTERRAGVREPDRRAVRPCARRGPSMTEEQITDAEVVDDEPSPGRELAPVTPRNAPTVTTPVTAGDLAERLGTIRDAMVTAMQRDVDYGAIPGADKP